MDMLLIPGNGRNSNQQWIQDVSDAVSESGFFKNVRAIRYKHWQLPGDAEMEDVNHELAKVRQAVDDVADGGDYIVFAKSAGSTLYLRALHEGARRPLAAVLVGIPMKSVHNPTYASVLGEGGFPAVLTRYTVPTIIIQNESERFIRPDGLRTFLKQQGVTSCEVVTGTDPGHTYSVDVVVHHVLAQAERVVPR